MSKSEQLPKTLHTLRQKLRRRKRFMARIWKVPASKRQEHRWCAACLEDEDDADEESRSALGGIRIMACDHWLHRTCHEKHVKAFAELNEIEDYKMLHSLDVLGAPCPMCRMEAPFRHYYVLFNASAHVV
jgi:hypothetical protein